MRVCACALAHGYSDLALLMTRDVHTHVVCLCRSLDKGDVDARRYGVTGMKVSSSLRGPAARSVRHFVMQRQPLRGANTNKRDQQHQPTRAATTNQNEQHENVKPLGNSRRGRRERRHKWQSLSAVRPGPDRRELRFSKGF